MTSEEYKALSVKEFTEAAKIYDSGHSGVYEMCKDDYPFLLEELEKEPFDTVLDCGCGTGPAIELLHEKYPEKHFTGLDLTPEMIHVAQEKKLSNTTFVVGDCENIPFPENSFDAIISSNSFHHYPNPQDFFNSAYRVLKKGGMFAIHDLMSPGRYGDMQAFVQKLRDMGYERVELIDTTDGSFMTPKEAKRLMLRGSTLLLGRK